MAAYPVTGTQGEDASFRANGGSAGRSDKASRHAGRGSVSLKYKGEVWRYVPRGAHPLHVGYLLQASGRWNRYGEYGCLYTALTRNGAVAEYEKYLRYAGLRREDDADRDLVTIQVDVTRTLDLTDPGVLKRFRLSGADIVADDDASLELCRCIADSARAEGYAGILSPSAAAKREKNLNIYIDGRAGNLRLDVGTVRQPLNY